MSKYFPFDLLENLFNRLFSIQPMKEKILVKAREEFFQQGIRKMLVQNLVGPLGISTKTFYKYFKNKEALLEEILTMLYYEQFNILKEYSKKQNPVQLLLTIWAKAFNQENNVNNKFYHDLKYYYPELERRVEAKVGQEFWLEFIQLIKRGINEGLFLEGILPDVVMESISVLYSTSVRTDQYAKFNISIEDSFLNTVAPIIRGICTDEGLIAYQEYFADN